MILNFNENEVTTMMMMVIDNFMLLANHMKGLCVVKKVIQKTRMEKFKKKILQLVEENALALVHNPFGNYAIQTALKVLVIFKYFK